MSGSDPVRVTADPNHEGVWRVLLDRGSARNAINSAIADGLDAAIDEVGAAGGKLVVLEAAGPVFSAGADLKELASGAAERAVRTVAASSVPWLAAVRGPAIGAGIALVSVCAFSVIGPQAWMSLPEVAAIDRFPVGVSAWLERHCGMRALLDVGLTGRRVTPARAVALGWATEQADDLDVALSARVAQLAALPNSVLIQAQESWRRWLGAVEDARVSA